MHPIPLIAALSIAPIYRLGPLAGAFLMLGNRSGLFGYPEAVKLSIGNTNCVVSCCSCGRSRVDLVRCGGRRSVMFAKLPIGIAMGWSPNTLTEPS